jgi:membrane fusion protein (multidrug efflux system)
MNKAMYLGLGLVAMVSVCGCQPTKAQEHQEPPPAEVGVTTISSGAVPITTELPGRLEAVRTAEVRARATGILLKRNFTEGADVKEGETLFEIDPAPLQASYASAEASLAHAEATLVQAESKAKRFKSLADVHAVSQQENDDAASFALQAKADVALAKAALETARLNLSYATVKAPITGRIGTAKVTEGALVSQAAATELAVIQQLDPIYVDFTQSSTEVLRLKQAFESGKLQSVADGEAKVTLLLEDGTTYPLPGKLLFSGLSVEPTTGMITLRAEFPNPDHLLLPGMFVRVRLEQGVQAQAITAPQRGVVLGPNGTATAMLVTKDNKVEAGPIKISTAIGDQWMVTSGLEAGDKIIVEGLQKIRPGALVKPVPFVAPSAATKPTETPKAS